MTRIIALFASAFFILHAAKPVLPPTLDPTQQNHLQSQPIDPTPFKRTGPTIQLAILLDSSNSMDGLIEQTKQQIWTIINELSAANRHNRNITLQVALFEYGKSTLPRSTNYIRKLSPLTNDLDFLSEKLFGLRTRGGQEYAGWVISKATDLLHWSHHPDDLKLIIIAGNESFAQGDMPYRSAIAEATAQGIIVNTIYCGNYRQGIRLYWKDGAMQGGGVYMNINQDERVVDIPTPYDDQILALNTQLNDTYIGYGSQGRHYKMRQSVQDKNAMGMSKTTMVNRSAAKTTKNYKTEGWDIVSAYEQDKKVIEKIETKTLPKKYHGKDRKEIAKEVALQLKKRKDIQNNIATLQKKRQVYIQKNKPKDQKDIGTVLIKNIKGIVIKNGYTFKK